ncbi:MAG TPA: pyruvate kinase [Verrucomicrobiota bacterium]|nr:pyruvate kinase [Verrucomicrobiota bacterium]HNU52668.1 pyruvate kinase [Verrucomicrobiota bacterium]
MSVPLRRTKIVATLGPASQSPEVIRRLVLAGMDVARLNFSHGSHEDHARLIACLRAVSAELDTPVTILQDLQGPKIRVGTLAGGECQLTPGEEVYLVPEVEYEGQPGLIPLDYAHAAQEVPVGSSVLLADGAFQLRIEGVLGAALVCRVVDGGVLRSRKGVNFPAAALRLPALTGKDRADAEFGLSQGVDWISLSFVRSGADVRSLKEFVAERGSMVPVMAKIEKPQAVERLDEILSEVSGVMVARGDLGVEMNPEKVPLLQKQIIESCNRRGLPVITATQMLESMIREPRPTRAEASDVANAIIDGTDAIMLSGESAVGAYPVRAVEMMDRIAREVEGRITFRSYPPPGRTETHALSEATTVIAGVVEPRCVAVLTTSGHTARFVASERPRTPVVALTTSERVYHALNLLWGIRPVVVQGEPTTFEGLVALAEITLRQRGWVESGDRVLVLGGVPALRPRGTNFIKIHTIE